MAPVLTLTRGTIVIAALKGDKPRPSLVVQSDLFNTTAQQSFTVIPFTSEIIAAPVFRLTFDPTPSNGLTKVSQLMVDKVTFVYRERMGAIVGQFADDEMIRVTRAMALWLGLT